MTTSKALRDDIANILDYLANAELAISVNETAITYLDEGERVSFVPGKGGNFLVERDAPTVKSYLAWVENNSYSAMLLDASLIQLTYVIEGRNVKCHRLAYVPAPFKMDPELVLQEPIVDLVELYMSTTPADIILNSSIRFDLDLENAKVGHPAAHLTINSPTCRIACSAPMHAGRFIDFVFRHFYRSHWKTHRSFFLALEHKNVGTNVIVDDDIYNPHVMWRTKLGDHS